MSAKLLHYLLDSSAHYLQSSTSSSSSPTSSVLSNSLPSSAFSSPTFSNYSTVPEATSSVSIVFKILIGFFLVLVILVSVFGNLLVCVAIFWDRKLRRLGNFFIVSLAIADLFVGALVMTFALANDLLDYWPFGPTLCELWIGFDISCSTCSIINLCAIALDRFAHIKDPMRYNRWMTKRIVIICITIIWLVSFGISFVPISLGWHKPDPTSTSSSVVNLLSSTPVNISNKLNHHFELPITSTPAPTSTTSTIIDELHPMHINLSALTESLPHHHLLHRHLSRIHRSTQPAYSVNTNSDVNSAKPDHRISSSSNPLMNSLFASSSTSDSSTLADDNFPALPQCALDLTLTYAVVSSIISFYLPCVIMVYLYLKLYSICQQHVKSIKSMTKFQPTPNNTTNNNYLPSSTPLTMTPIMMAKSNMNHHHHHHHHNGPPARISVSSNMVAPSNLGSQSHASEHKAAVTLGIIMGTFLACWMPFFCINIVSAYCKTCIPPLFFKILTWLGYFNSCLNPAIYSIFNTEFRDAFRRILIRYLFNGDTTAACSRLVPCKTPRSSTITVSGSQTTTNHHNGSKNHFNVMTCPLNQNRPENGNSNHAVYQPKLSKLDSVRKDDNESEGESEFKSQEDVEVELIFQQKSHEQNLNSPHNLQFCDTTKSSGNCELSFPCHPVADKPTAVYYLIKEEPGVLNQPLLGGNSSNHSHHNTQTHQLPQQNQRKNSQPHLNHHHNNSTTPPKLQRLSQYPQHQSLDLGSFPERRSVQPEIFYKQTNNTHTRSHRQRHSSTSSLNGTSTSGTGKENSCQLTENNTNNTITQNCSQITQL